MPPKKHIIIIGVLCVIALGLGYWVGMPKEEGSGVNGKKEPEFLKQGLVAYYPFNGNAKDESGNRHDGFVDGATLTPDRFGRGSEAYSFDGKNDYIKVSDHADLRLGSVGTVTLWGMARSITGTRPFISKDGDNYNDDMGIGINSNGQAAKKLTFNFQRSPESDNPFIAETVAFYLNKWVFISGVWDNAGFKLYLDGRLIGDHSTTVESIASGYHLYFGADIKQTPRYLDGSLDDVRIYNRALTEAEVKALYEFEKPKTQQTSAPTLKEKVTGTYERKEGAITESLVSLDNRAMEHYVNGDKTPTEWKWSLVGKEIHIDRGGRTSTLAYRINPDDSITAIASITNGKRTDLPNKGQLTYIKIK